MDNHNKLAVAVSAAADSINIDIYVTDGPKLHSLSERADHKAKISSDCARMKSSATYAEFEASLRCMHELGVFLDDSVLIQVVLAGVSNES